jgi:hypothetical protein
MGAVQERDLDPPLLQQRGGRESAQAGPDDADVHDFSLFTIEHARTVGNLTGSGHAGPDGPPARVVRLDPAAPGPRRYDGRA